MAINPTNASYANVHQGKEVPHSFYLKMYRHVPSYKGLLEKGIGHLQGRMLLGAYFLSKVCYTHLSVMRFLKQKFGDKPRVWLQQLKKKWRVYRLQRPAHNRGGHRGVKPQTPSTPPPGGGPHPAEPKHIGGKL